MKPNPLADLSNLPGGKRRWFCRRKRRWLKPLAVVLLLLLTGAVALFAAVQLYQAQLDRDLAKLAELPAEERRITTLVLGVDTREADSGRSDTIMLVSFDPVSGETGVLSIPRDTRVKINERRYDKINVAYPLGGPELVRQTVEELLGIKVDHYIIIDFPAFERIVDALGGVVLEVSKPMYYQDRAQNLVIDIKEGLHQLNGAEALGYVRYRNDRLGDISLVDPVNGIYDGRVQRQLAFVQALVAQALKPQNWLRAPFLVKQLTEALESDLSSSQLADLILLAKKVNADNLTTRVLPGRAARINGASYWIADEPEMKKVVRELVMGEDESANM
ncbi:MAG TPA: LCP family protein [Firmicutes bacterium]|nr:LCP family protein [Bacillota bacterium]